jgi:uncharacterized membrane protein YfcA
MDNPLFVTIAAGLVIFAAFFIRSLTGFGSALVGIPLLALLYDLKFAVPMEALFEFGFSILLMRSVYKDIGKGIIVPLIIGTVAGSLLGTYVLVSFANLYLKKLLGFAVTIFAIHLLTRKTEFAEKPLSPGWGISAGTLGGIFGGMFGTSGPAFVAYLSYRIRRKEILRASLIGLFSIDYTWRICLYAGAGLLTSETIELALVLTPALVLGTVLGHKTHARIDERRFHQIVAGLLLFSGISLLIW